MVRGVQPGQPIGAPTTFGARVRRDMVRHWPYYLMILPAVIYYVIFHYLPMLGITMAFETYRPRMGIFGSPWVGLDNFKAFFSSYYFGRLLRNTVFISVLDIIFSFPAAILFALLLNELRGRIYKKAVQTISYLPYFVSLVIVCGLVKDFTENGGVISQLVEALGGPSGSLIANPSAFRTIYVGSGIWQNLGYNSIIYICAMTAIDPELYESARIDGAGRLRQTLHITLPGIAPTIIIMLILRVGSIMTVGHEKIILLYSPATYETADVISSFVYRRGLLESDYSFATAVGLFNSVCNLVLICATNYLSKRYTESSLW